MPRFHTYTEKESFVCLQREHGLWARIRARKDPTAGSWSTYRLEEQSLQVHFIYSQVPYNVAVTITFDIDLISSHLQLPRGLINFPFKVS
jgi:hypothetical protein